MNGSTRTLRACLVVLVVSVIAACGLVRRPEPSLPARGTEYFPLERGTWWVYDVEDRTFDLSFRRRVEVTNTLRVPEVGDLAVLEETNTTGEGPVFRAPVQPIGFHWQEGYLHLLYLTEQGGELRPFEAMQAMRILPESVDAPKSWLDDSSPPTGLRFRVERKHELHLDEPPVTIGGVRFPTIRVDTIEVHRGSAPRRELRDVRYYYSDWYAPRVGLVRSETWDDAARRRLRVRIELVEFGHTSDRTDDPRR